MRQMRRGNWIRGMWTSIVRTLRLLAPQRVHPKDRGEIAAAKDLERLGWEILAANVVIGVDEADLVCRDPRGAPVLVEVKSGHGGAMPPELQVGPRKQAALRRLALKLARDRRFQFGTPPRIDVVVVRLGECDAIERHLVAAVGDGPRRIGSRGVSSRNRHAGGHFQ